MRLLSALFAVFLVASPVTAQPASTDALPQVKAGEHVSFRFGLLLQPQADFSQDADGGTQQNLMLRRIRLIVSGQVAKKAFVYFQTENSRLGAAGKNGKQIAGGFQTLDAVAEYRHSRSFNIWAGLMYVPTSREAMKSSTSEFMLDTSAYATTASNELSATGGRDTGILARGYFFNDRLEYRLGAFQGIRDAGAHNTFRKTARLQYEFFDTETYAFPSYTGAYFGTKTILAVGIAYDGQHNYRGPTADLFWDLPTRFGSTLGTVTVTQIDGKNSVPSLPKSTIFSADSGLFFKGSKLGPWARYEHRRFAAPNRSRNEKRYQIGLNWYPHGNSFNIKLGVGELKPESGRTQRELTLQLQLLIN